MGLSIILVVGFGLLGGYLVSTAGDRVAVVTVSGNLAEGERIEAGDLAEASVSGVAGAISFDEVDDLVGQIAAVDLVDGQVLTAAMLTSDPLPGAGQAVVGLALDTARAPAAGLRPGDLVTVIAVAPVDAAATPEDLDAPTVLAESAQVASIGGSTSLDGSDAPDGGVSAGGQVVLTLLVDESDAARLAAYSTANQVALVQTSPVADDQGEG
ncbi:SAF domain-containing protein [Nocardioides zeae]|uniref:SAF domain-containing protein n=1 Tax=Nocardioides imazamoxiresistens TaxID=3231893 RepID=A0ABU3Q032_9ACTN|nr:SAF domain-containing protein [Nocardioides zeae]MDT9594878.1 SAF domain-containing protein [Nocardioides zeae]